MLKVSSSSNGNSTWFEYCDEFEDYFPVYEQCDGQYYTFCSYNLNDEEMEEIRTSLNSTGCYPVWLFEWSDVITKKEYESLTPKTKPVSLPAMQRLLARQIRFALLRRPVCPLQSALLFAVLAASLAEFII